MHFKEDTMTMRRSPHTAGLWILLAGSFLATNASAQQGPPAVTGQGTYATFCATCHGTSGKGDGPLATSLTPRPPDLTLIASRNGGTFPMDRVARIVDGRAAVKGHGGGEMPVWGDAFANSRDATPVEDRIRRVVAYLASIQAKP